MAFLGFVKVFMLLHNGLFDAFEFLRVSLWRLAVAGCSVINVFLCSFVARHYLEEQNSWWFCGWSFWLWRFYHVLCLCSHALRVLSLDVCFSSVTQMVSEWR